VTRHGIQPIPKKVEAILQIAEPRTKTELRRFIGMINFYRDMWIHRSDVMSPLSDATAGPKKGLLNWTPACRQAFADIKKIIAQKVLLTFPDFSK